MAETPEPDRELSGDEAGQALSKAFDVVLRGGQRGGKSAALDLEAMKARCNAATAGPWHQGPHYRSDVESRCGRICETKLNTPQGVADAEFIAHARMDVPNLIREIEEQCAEAAPVRPMQPWHNTKYAGEGVGSVGPFRVVLRTVRKTGERFIEVLHDEDAGGYSFTRRQLKDLIPVLQTAVDKLTKERRA